MVGGDVHGRGRPRVRARSCRSRPSTSRGSNAVLDLGCGEGQLARRARRGSRPGPGSWSASSPRPRSSPARPARPADRATCGGRGSSSRSGTALRRHRLLSRHRARDRPRRAPRRGGPRCSAPGGRFLLLVNHPMFQGSGSGFVDDQILGEHYWRVGPYLREDVVFEEVDPGVRLRFAHRPLSRYVNPLAALGCVLTRWRSPSRRRRSSKARSTWNWNPRSRGCCCSVSNDCEASRWEDERVAEYLILSGMSGAGRSTAAATLEDLGWFVIDNLPPALIGKVAELASQAGRSTSGSASSPGGAATRDRRARPARSPKAAARPGRACGCCSSTPRTTCCPPLRGDPPPPPASRPRASCSVDPAGARHAPGAPRRGRRRGRHQRTERAPAARAPGRAVRRTGRLERRRCETSVVSFGFKHGLPLDVDLVFDCRFLPNPHWVPTSCGR